MWSVAMIDMKVMMSEAPSSAPSTGRNELEEGVKPGRLSPRTARSRRRFDLSVGRFTLGLHFGQGVDGVENRLHSAADDDLIAFPGLGNGTHDAVDRIDRLAIDL